MVHVASFRVRLSWRDQYCGLDRLEHGGVVYYFVDNEYYFKRSRLYGYGDDGERIAFFSKAVLECLPYMDDFSPNVLHCHDWHAALIPVYLRELFQGAENYRRVRTVLTIHNLKFQGVFPRFMIGDVLGLDSFPAAVTQLTRFDSVNYLRGGLCYTDAITTVSPTYARRSVRRSTGRARRISVPPPFHPFGHLNGIDTAKYDRQPIRRSADLQRRRPERKADNKKSLRDELG
jgi:starch synthase